MRPVDSEVLVKIEETVQEIKLLNNSENPEDEDRLAFLFLEEELKVRGIRELGQLPIRGEKTVVQFVNSLPSDRILFKVLQKLEFTECIPFPTFTSHRNTLSRIKGSTRSRNRPTCVSPYVTGTGYHSLTDQSTGEDGVYDFGDLVYPSFIGFSLPQHLNCTRVGKIYETFNVFRSPSHYASLRLQELKLPLLSTIGRKWAGEPKLGYNIRHTKSYGDIAFTFVREYRQFSLHIDSTSCIPLQSSFISKLKEVTADHHVRPEAHQISDWEEFFQIYGTHVITSSNGGGCVVITVLENQLKNFFGVNDLSQKEIIQEIGSTLSRVLDSDEPSRRDAIIPNWESKGTPIEVKDLIISSIKLQGGDPEFANLDLTECHKPGEIKDIISKWSATLSTHPIMFDSQVSVEPIANILEQHGMKEMALQFDIATQKIYGKSFYKCSSKKSESKSWMLGLWSTNSK